MKILKVDWTFGRHVMLHCVFVACWHVLQDIRRMQMKPSTYSHLEWYRLSYRHARLGMGQCQPSKNGNRRHPNTKCSVCVCKCPPWVRNLETPPYPFTAHIKVQCEHLRTRRKLLLVDKCTLKPCTECRRCNCQCNATNA